MVTSSFVKLLPDGHIDLNDLEEQLAANAERCFVSLMHANNEIGNLLDIYAAGEICKNIMPFFILIRCKRWGIIKLTFVVSRCILPQGRDINFTVERGWYFICE